MMKIFNRCSLTTSQITMNLFSFTLTFFLFSASVGAIITTQPTLPNATNIHDNIEAFFKSISKIASLSNEQFRQVSKQITAIGAKLNQSTSECYELITATLNHGFNKSWSSKSKLLSDLRCKQ